MKKLKLQMQFSIDGFVAGPNGEMDGIVVIRYKPAASK